MRAIWITDPADDRLADYRDLTDVALRRVLEPEGGLYIAESAKVIARAIAAGHRPRSVLVQEKWLADIEELVTDDVPVYVVTPDIAEALTGYAVHRGALAAMHRPVLPALADVVAGARLVVVLEDIVDHTNVGAIFRDVGQRRPMHRGERAAVHGVPGQALGDLRSDDVYRHRRVGEDLLDVGEPFLLHEHRPGAVTRRERSRDDFRRLRDVEATLGLEHAPEGDIREVTVVREPHV